MINDERQTVRFSDEVLVAEKARKQLGKEMTGASGVVLQYFSFSRWTHLPRLLQATGRPLSLSSSLFLSHTHAHTRTREQL